RAVAERRETLIERRVGPALHPAAERVGCGVVNDLCGAARRCIPGRGGRRLARDAVVLVHEIRERGAEVEERPDAAVAARDRGAWQRGGGGGCRESGEDGALRELARLAVRHGRQAHL